MDIIGLLITIVILIAAIALVQWFVRASGVTIPQPVVIVIYAALVVAALIFLARFAGVARVW